ncbi:Uncharacterised protein [Vibrio cholerae]|nr:Uncharacterised protein [Vibrio cholerae]CSB69286.1 Uncharacterised protein [Vibrio cholerae]CSH98981.1 Uncharacterised protein [Vibrio cholerae]
MVANVEATKPKIPKGARRMIKRTIWEMPWLRSSNTALVVDEEWCSAKPKPTPQAKMPM